MFDRPILIIAIAYIIGILWGLYLEINIPPFFIIIIILVITILVIIIGYRNIKEVEKNIFKEYDIIEKKHLLRKKIKLIIIGCMVLIISKTNIQFRESFFNQIYKMDENNLNYIGTVTKVIKENEYYYSYIIDIKKMFAKSEILETELKGFNLLLRVEKNNGVKLEYGDLIYGAGLIKRPAIRRNFKGFDYSQYLKSQNITVICDSKQENIKILKKNALPVINMWINKLQIEIKGDLMEVLPRENANIAIAILLGDSSYLEQQQKELFSNANLSHILAISGMHISYIITRM